MYDQRYELGYYNVNWSMADKIQEGKLWTRPNNKGNNVIFFLIAKVFVCINIQNHCPHACIEIN